MDRNRDVLTTGQVARICRVAPRTVSKWFDTGQLRGYRIPGSKDRRIPKAQLIRFMKAHGIPLEGLQGGARRILIVDADSDLTALLLKTLTETLHYDVRVASSAFEAGAITTEFHPDVLLLDIDVVGIEGRLLSRFFAAHPELSGVQMIATSASLTDSDRHHLLQQGFHHTLRKPFHLSELAEIVEEGMHAMA